MRRVKFWLQCFDRWRLGTKIWRLIDRDDMTDSARHERIQQGVNVLTRRELENYLYDPDVLTRFCERENKLDLVSSILAKAQELLNGEQTEFVDLKPITRELLDYIQKTTRIPNLGKDRREFALEHLVPALREAPNILDELERDIFRS